MINFISLGYDCSCASALKGLELRQFSLPFDWIQSNYGVLEKCILDNFEKFHTNIILVNNKTRVMDDYGFQFSHDYPVIESSTPVTGAHASEKQIVDNYMEFYDEVKEKYNRRIKRFIDILQDSNTPIIALSRYHDSTMNHIKELFIKKYNRNDIIFVNANERTNELKIENNIINYNIEKHNIWNDKDMWKEAVDFAISILNERNSNNFNLHP